MECKIHIQSILEISSYKKPKQTKNIENQKQGQPTKPKLKQGAIYKAKQKSSILQSQSSSSQSNALLCSVGDRGQQQ